MKMSSMNKENKYANLTFISFTDRLTWRDFFTYEFNFKVKFVSLWHFTVKSMNTSISEFQSFIHWLCSEKFPRETSPHRTIDANLFQYIYLIYLFTGYLWATEVWFPLNFPLKHCHLSVFTMLSWMASLNVLLSLCLISTSTGELNPELKIDYYKL